MLKKYTTDYVSLSKFYYLVLIPFNIIAVMQNLQKYSKKWKLKAPILESYKVYYVNFREYSILI